MTKKSEFSFVPDDFRIGLEGTHIFLKNIILKIILSWVLILLCSFVASGQSKEIQSKLQKRNQTFGTNGTFIPRTYYGFPRYDFNGPINPYFFPGYDPYFYSPIYPWYSPRVLIPDVTYPSITGTTRSSSTRNTNSFFALGLNLPYRPTTNDIGVGMFMAGGKDNFFIFSLDVIGSNPYPYYSNISKYEAASWGDAYLGKESETFSYSIGGGRRFNNFYPYVAVSILSTDNYLIYWDDTYILSSNGRYTIDGISNTQMGATFGFLVRAQNVSFNFSGSSTSVISGGIGFIF
jgi:hypothetical protein